MDDKRLFVLITVRHGKSTSKLTFAYDALENGLCKNARSPENLTESVLDDAVRFTNHLIVSSYGFLRDKYTLDKNVFATLEANGQTISEFQRLIKESMKKGQPLEFVKLRWNVK